MAKIAVVTDSSAYIPSALLEGLPIFTIPLVVLWDGQTYLDGKGIQPAAFYERLKVSKTLPTTSQSSPKAFIDFYRPLLDQGYEILSIHISSKLSGTIDSANQAKQALADKRIHVFDSTSASMGMGFQVLAAARLALQGGSINDCLVLLENARANSGAVFLVKTLEFLHRGGRIGGAAAFLGTVIDLKPILEIRDGRIEALEKVRTMSKAIDRMLDIFESKLIKLGDPIHISSLYADTPDAAEILLERAKQRFRGHTILDSSLTPVSPAIGTHVGPGTMGLCYLAGL
jgi:DegV family protein with EDD domain